MVKGQRGRRRSNMVARGRRPTGTSCLGHGPDAARTRRRVPGAEAWAIAAHYPAARRGARGRAARKTAAPPGFRVRAAFLNTPSLPPRAARPERARKRVRPLPWVPTHPGRPSPGARAACRAPRCTHAEPSHVPTMSEPPAPRRTRPARAPKRTPCRRSTDGAQYLFRSGKHRNGREGELCEYICIHLYSAKRRGFPGQGVLDTILEGDAPRGSRAPAPFAGPAPPHCRAKARGPLP